MHRHTMFILALLLIYASVSFAQDAGDVTGTWKGTSVCQQKNSPCHDEIAVYHAEKTNLPGQYRFAMNKVVNGQEEEMGVLTFLYDKKAQAYFDRHRAQRGLAIYRPRQ